MQAGRYDRPFPHRAPRSTPREMKAGPASSLPRLVADHDLTQERAGGRCAFVFLSGEHSHLGRPRGAVHCARRGNAQQQPGAMPPTAPGFPTPSFPSRSRPVSLLPRRRGHLAGSVSPHWFPSSKGIAVEPVRGAQLAEPEGRVLASYLPLRGVLRWELHWRGSGLQPRCKISFMGSEEGAGQAILRGVSVPGQVRQIALRRIVTAETQSPSAWFFCSTRLDPDARLQISEGLVCLGKRRARHKRTISTPKQHEDALVYLALCAVAAKGKLRSGCILPYVVMKTCGRWLSVSRWWLRWW